MRDAYASFLPSVTRGCDLYISFYDQGLNLLRPEGVLCFICADRWMQNGYGKLLRGRISDAFCLESVIRLQGSAMFESAVSAYPVITVSDLLPTFFKVGSRSLTLLIFSALLLSVRAC